MIQRHPAGGLEVSVEYGIGNGCAKTLGSEIG
jgi:hypothetical protein